MGTRLFATIWCPLLLLGFLGAQCAFAQELVPSSELSINSSTDSAHSASSVVDSTIPILVPTLGGGVSQATSANAGVVEEEDFLGDGFLIAPGEESLLGHSVTKTAVSNAVSPNVEIEKDSSRQHIETIPARDQGAITPDEPIVRPELNLSIKPVTHDSALTNLGGGDSGAYVPAAVVEDVRSINFAQNLKDYRSPKLAMLLSFILPGAGQVYSRSIAKSALFAAAEIGIVGASIAFWAQGNRKSDDFLEYANTRFNADKFAAYYKGLSDSLLVWRNGDSAEARSRLQTFYSLPYRDDEYAYIDTFQTWASQRSDEFYKDIQQNQFVHGWLDAEPSLSEIIGAYRNSNDNDSQLSVGGHVYPLEPSFVGDSAKDNSFLLWVPHPAIKNKQIIGQGYSQYQFTYNQMVSDARTSYNRGLRLLLVLLLNHIGSAIDAGLTAKRHNDALLGRHSVWQRLELEQQWVCSGSQMAPGYAVRVSF